MRIPARVSSWSKYCCVLVLLSHEAFAADAPYVPSRSSDWEHRIPSDVGLDPDLLEEAIAFAIAQETKFDGALGEKASARDLRLKQAFNRASEPHNSPIGPITERGDPTGMILRGGYIVAQWGDVERVDMTFSVSKTFLSSVAGIAFDQRLIGDVHSPVFESVPDLFDTPHNRPITWDHLLRQTSGWQGTLWDKPDWADRPGDEPWSAFVAGPLEPGNHWKYNDVRVNVLALALLHVFGEPLPSILKQNIMDPIGASDTWIWHGYDNSWVEINGKRMQSVSGGGHWGGGMFISAQDLARLGLLASRDGRWGGTQILSQQWIDFSRQPTDVRPGYGYMNWFLNTDQERFPSAPESAVVFYGAGTNMVYVDKENELVAVVRWIDYRKTEEFVAYLLNAVKK